MFDIWGHESNYPDVFPQRSSVSGLWGSVGRNGEQESWVVFYLVNSSWVFSTLKDSAVLPAVFDPYKEKNKGVSILFDK